MEMTYYASVAESGYAEQVRQLMVLADKEFIPPLSARSSSTQSSLTDADSDTGSVDAYFASMVSQPVILALENEHVAGFMAFKFDHICQQIRCLPNLYASTSVVHPDFRGRGLMRGFYEAMIARFPDRSVCTRTWSTNFSHLHVLGRLGFSEIARLKDHRGVGLDTVYFCRQAYRG